MNVLQKHLSIKFHILKEKSSQKETATELKVIGNSMNSITAKVNNNVK